MALKKSDVVAAIHGSSEDFFAQVIDSVEFSCGKLTDDQSNELYQQLESWLIDASDSFQFSPAAATE